MLQQTQVATVIPYFLRFTKRFPDLPTLAATSVDEVLSLWSGLGYYARARHLHETARQVVANYRGELPQSLSALQGLPGLGRSTAAAILALAWDQPQAILDGNVKRVLTRYRALPGWPGLSKVNEQLWEIAEAFTPSQRVADYTQAIMDLGATLCTRTHPACHRCPVREGCLALRMGDPTAYPHPSPRKILPIRRQWFLILLNEDGAVWLERRPPSGVWGGLWSLPACDWQEDPMAWLTRQYGFQGKFLSHWSVLRHSFSHFHLDIYPWLGRWQGDATSVLEGKDAVWYKLTDTPPGGMATPVTHLLGQIINYLGD